MDRTLVSPLYRKAWPLLEREFESYPSFSKYVGGVQRRTQENLQRWRASGKPQRWVEQHRGNWNHEDWFSLLERLMKSEYWPMDPGEVGLMLEELKANHSGAGKMQC
jgi:hypothetical protein